MSGPKREEVRGHWRKLHNEELHDLWFSPNIILVIKYTMMEWVGDVSCRGEKRSAYTALVLKPKRRRPLGRPQHTWDSTDWINQAQDRNKRWAVVNM
jgi:hypothetical protein